jgi:hypothetical protein
VLNHGKYSDLTSAQYEALGKLFVEWSNTEFLLGLLLSRLLFTPEFLGRTYSDEMNAARLEKAIVNALDIHRYRYNRTVVTEADDSNIRNLLKEVASCRALRNKFAHYLWMRSTDDEIVGFRMSGKPPDTKREGDALKISMSELQNAHRQNHALVEKLQQVALRLPKVSEEQNLPKRERP